MSHSHGDFVTIINIPEVCDFYALFKFYDTSNALSCIFLNFFHFKNQGNHEYKYIVDGNELVNNNAKIDESSKNNVINVKKSDFEVFEALAMDLASNTKSNEYNTSNGSPKGSYSQEMPNTYELSRQQSGSGPPILPPHLLQVILNNPNVSGEPTL